MGRLSNITDRLGLGSSVEDDLDQIQTHLGQLDNQKTEADIASSYAESKGFENMAGDHGDAIDTVEDALAQGKADLAAFNQDSPKAAPEARENASTLMEYAREIDETRTQGIDRVESNYEAMAESVNTGIRVANRVAQENHSTVSEDVNWSDLDSQIDNLDNAYKNLTGAGIRLQTSVYAENPGQVQEKFGDILGDEVEGEVTYDDVETALGDAKEFANKASNYLSEAGRFENSCANMSGTIENVSGYWSDAAEKLQ